MTTAEISLLSTKMSAVCPKSYTICVVQDYHCLPKKILDRYDRYISSIQSACDSDKKIIYLIANRLPRAKDVVRIWLREVVEHEGLYGLFDFEEDDIFLDDLYEKFSKFPELDFKQYEKDELSDEREITIEIINTFAHKYIWEKNSELNKNIWKIIEDAIQNLYKKIYLAIIGEELTKVSLRTGILIAGLGRRLFFGRDNVNEEEDWREIEFYRDIFSKDNWDLI